MYLTVAVALDEEHRSEQVDAIKKLLSDTVISDVTPKATLFGETVADDVSLEISDSYVQLQKGTDTVLVSAFKQKHRYLAFVQVSHTAERSDLEIR